MRPNLKSTMQHFFLSYSDFPFPKTITDLLGTLRFVNCCAVTARPLYVPSLIFVMKRDSFCFLASSFYLFFLHFFQRIYREVRFYMEVQSMRGPIYEAQRTNIVFSDSSSWFFCSDKFLVICQQVLVLPAFFCTVLTESDFLMVSIAICQAIKQIIE